MGSLRLFGSAWGRAYFAQLLAGRLRAPVPTGAGRPVDLVVLVANHFEPLWGGHSLARGVGMTQDWCAGFAALGVEDSDGRPFRHTYFFPAEQYHPDLLEPLAAHCAEGFGEVEVHLHHGVDAPDTPDRLESALVEFLARLREHGCGAFDRDGRPGYAFVHGNWALANSAGGVNCGVDEEMAILARTGCYVDCTLPSAPDRSQVPAINAIYQCGHPLHTRAPHRSGPRLRLGQRDVVLPILLQGPLVVDWTRRLWGLPVPRLDIGDLSAEFAPDLERFRRWTTANIHVADAPSWVFVKLHTHGLIERHRETLLGAPMRRFLRALVDAYGEDAGYRIHFVTAREAANLVFAALDGQMGNPNDFRDYRFVPPRHQSATPTSTASAPA